MQRHDIEALVERGDEFYQNGDYERAIDFYVQALEVDIKNQEALEGLGQSYASLCKWERAVYAFELLLDTDPDYAVFHYFLGQALSSSGDCEHGLNELHKAESLGYQTSDLYSAIGFALHMQGDLSGAIRSYRTALDLDPNDTATMYNYSKALVAERSYVAARKVLEDVVQTDPEDVQAWIALGEVYEDLNEADMAFHAYERALDLDPSSPDARCLAAHVCLMIGRPDEAEWEYSQVVKENPNDSDAWAGLGEVLIAQERYLESLEACRKALQLDPVSVYALSGYTSACERIGAFDDARRAVAEAVDRDPGSADLWYMLAGVEAAAGAPEQALSAYGQAVRLNPTDAGAHAGIAWALTEMGRDYALAEVHLLESVRLAPDWYYPCLQLGELFLKHNDRITAAEWFARAIEIAPDEPEVHQTLADPEIRRLLCSDQHVI